VNGGEQMSAKILLGKREKAHNGVVLTEPQILVSIIVDGKPVSNLKSSGGPMCGLVAKAAVRTGHILRCMGIMNWHYVPDYRIRYLDGEAEKCGTVDVGDFTRFSELVKNTVVFGF
jgi:hypothetical protein